MHDDDMTTVPFDTVMNHAKAGAEAMVEARTVLLKLLYAPEQDATLRLAWIQQLDTVLRGHQLYLAMLRSLFAFPTAREEDEY